MTIPSPSRTDNQPPGTERTRPADVLHLGKYYPPEPGGIEQVVQSLIEATHGELEHYALLASRSGRSRIVEVPGARLHFLREWGTFLLAPILPTLPFVLHRLRRQGRIPVLLLHAPNPVAIISLALSFALLPKRESLVVWHHADVLFDAAWKRALHRLYLPFERFVFRRADRFVAATPHHVESSSVLRRYRERTTVVPYAIDSRWFAPTVASSADLQTVRERMGGRFVLFVGRLAAYKGLETLLEAARDIEARIAIVGQGPLEFWLRREIGQRGLGDKFRLVGRVEDLRPWYDACELLVLPSTSRLEAFGVVQIEAMACGKPVVSSDLPTGVTWVNRHGETGLTFRVGDTAALAEACNRLLGDEVLRTRLGASARERARREFSYATLGRRFVGLIRASREAPLLGSST